MHPVGITTHAADEVAKVQADTGMDRLQAERHVKQRAALISRHRSHSAMRAAECARAWAARQGGAA